MNVLQKRSVFTLTHSLTVNMCCHIFGIYDSHPHTLEIQTVMISNVLMMSLIIVVISNVRAWRRYIFLHFTTICAFYRRFVHYSKGSSYGRSLSTYTRHVLMLLLQFGLDFNNNGGKVRHMQLKVHRLYIIFPLLSAV